MIGVIKGTMRQAKEVSGLPLPIASYKANLKAPYRSLKVAITAKQSGSGTPYPAGGGKNKLNCTATTTTQDGVTFTVNADGTVATNNTATTTTIFTVGSFNVTNGTTYTLNGLPSNGGYNTFGFQIRRGDYNIGNIFSENGDNYTATADETLTVVLVVRTGFNASGMLFKPMIRLASVTDSTFAPYSNIRPISGVSECNVCNTPMPVSQLWSIDSSFNGIVNFNQLVENGNFADTSGWKTNLLGTLTTSDNVGTFAISNFNNNARFGRTSKISLTQSHIYLMSIAAKTSSSNTIVSRIWKNSWSNGVTLTSSWQKNEWLVKPNSDVSSDDFPFGFNTTSATSGDTIDVKNTQVIDITQMFGSTIADYIYSLEQGETGAGVTFFRSIYPNDYYAYDTGTDEMVGSREGNTDTIQLGDTYYGGSLDVTTGVLTVTWFYLKGGFTQYASGNGYKAYRKDNLPRSKAQSTGGISNMIGEFGSFSSSAMNKNIISLPISTTLYMALDENYNASDVEVIYELAKPITVQLTPTQVEQLLGTNNVWADTGDVEELEYTDRQVYYGR